MVGFCISLIIEISQVILTKYGLIFRRIFDVDDLKLNILGFLIGYLINIGIRFISRRIVFFECISKWAMTSVNTVSTCWLRPWFAR